MQPATRSYRWLFVSLAVIGLAADLGTKYGMFHWLHNGGQAVDQGAFRTYAFDGQVVHGEYDVIPGWFKFTAEFDPATPTAESGLQKSLQTWSAPVMPRVNHGALFGIGQQHKGLSNGVFAVVCVVAAVAIGIWVSRGQARHDRWLCTALGLVCAGTLGNFYDRVVFGGVRDFLHFYKQYQGQEWPVFNVADCCLVVGACVLLVQAMFAPSPEKKTATVEPQPAATPVP
ncbi:signal peptidase II [Limnoglobus roseus]|uniref:Lipoprotein signal peptidase n=1 Tax=Limnoglobus roseus TaxID=2598579 RepID=A0A5C1ADJ1_9BACT|nr:signal peptidase II [Limnoglobus roseus]QEL16066.1 signal peptidase II [Limnoglobus roseus]